MKQYYSEYARHCLNLRFTVPRPPLDRIGAWNWRSADKVLTHYSEGEIELLKKLYSDPVVPMSAIVKEVSISEQIDLKDLWDIVKWIQYEVAVERELVENKDVRRHSR